MPVYAMKNSIQPYAWGSVDSLEQLFGIPNPDGQPQAELWMGAHPVAPSKLIVEGDMIALDRAIDTQPEPFIGAEAKARYGVQLPFLFKILAARTPLSIQLHPCKAASEEGYARENAAGIAMSDPKRNYKDANHKPELIYALTPFKAMHSFRPFDEMLSFFALIDGKMIPSEYVTFAATPSNDNFKQFFSALMQLENDDKQRAVAALLHVAKANVAKEPFTTVVEFEHYYPGDIGLFSPLLLNLLDLAPGEAFFVDAGVPHAYLWGTGLEIMANSDNVLRAGLTPKNMDIPELIANTRFEPASVKLLRVTPKTYGDIRRFEVPVQDFNFALQQLDGEAVIDVQQATILLCIKGDVTISSGSEELRLQRGESCFISAGSGSYQLSGHGELACASHGL